MYEAGRSRRPPGGVRRLRGATVHSPTGAGQARPPDVCRYATREPTREKGRNGKRVRGAGGQMSEARRARETARRDRRL